MTKIGDGVTSGDGGVTWHYEGPTTGDEKGRTGRFGFFLFVRGQCGWAIISFCDEIC